MLTKQILEDYIIANLNKPCVYGSRIGRLVGYAETDSGFTYYIEYGYGKEEKRTLLDAGLKLSLIEPENELFDSVNSLLEINGCPSTLKMKVADFTNNDLYSSRSKNYLKAWSQHLLNKIIMIDKNIYRLIGYTYDAYGHSYITYDLKGQKNYHDMLSFNPSKYVETPSIFSKECLEYFENIIPKTEKIVFEDFEKEEDEL